MKIPSYKADGYIQNIDKQKLAGCLVFGPQASLVDFFVKKIAPKIVADIADPFLVVNIDKDRIGENPSIIADEFFSLSMLGGRKLIMVNDSSVAVTNSLKSIIANDSFADQNNNFILIHGGDLEKSNGLRKIFEADANLAAIACYEENEATIKQFITQLLTANSLKFSRDVVEMIFKKCGNSRDQIKFEIDKINLYFAEDKNLDIKKLESLLVDKSELSINEFVKNFADKNYNLAIMQAKKLIRDGNNVVTLLRFLSNYYSKLYNAKVAVEKRGMALESAVKSQRLFFKMESDFKNHLQKTSLINIAKIIKFLQNSELDVKQGNASPDFIFSKFMKR